MDVDSPSTPPRVLDEPFLVVTLKGLEVVARPMASPAPIEAPVQRGGFKCS
jgi:hypothetical protein